MVHKVAPTDVGAHEAWSAGHTPGLGTQARTQLNLRAEPRRRPDVRGAFIAAYESVLPLGKDDAGALEDSIEAHLRRIPWPG